MKKVYLTYVDNQREIQYPIAFLKKENPSLIVFCSDRENQKALYEEGIESIIIDKKITSPADIAHAQNACIEYAIWAWDPDFIIYQQADVWMAPEGQKAIDGFCEFEHNIDEQQALYLRHIRLFQIGNVSHWGVNVFGKNFKKRFIDDGASMNHWDGFGSKDGSVDIGYLSIDQYKRHLRKHAITWSSDSKIFDLPDQEFVKEIFKRETAPMTLSGFPEEGSIYYDLYERMGLLKEFEIVKGFYQAIKMSEQQ